MKATAAIFGKELRQYLGSHTFFWLCGLVLLITGILFMLSLTFYFRNMFAFMQTGINVTEQILAPLMRDAGVILLFILPPFTMRLLAEERRQGTLELLFTSPVSPVHVILGKFLAAWAVVLIPITALLSYPLLLEPYTRIDWKLIAANYLGLFLLSGSFLALGLFLSAITASPLNSALLTWGALIVLFLLDYILRGGKPFLASLSVWGQFQNFSQGLISLSGLVFFFSFMGLFLFLTLRFLEGQGWR